MLAIVAAALVATRSILYIQPLVTGRWCVAAYPRNRSRDGLRIKARAATLAGALREWITLYERDCLSRRNPNPEKNPKETQN